MAPKIPIPTPQKLGRSSLRLVAWGLALLAIYLLILFAGNVVQGERMQALAHEERTAIALLESEQRALQDELSYTESDAAIERLARDRLELARPNETILYVATAIPTPQPTPEAVAQVDVAPTAIPTPQPANWRSWWSALFAHQ